MRIHILIRIHNLITKITTPVQNRLDILVWLGMELDVSLRKPII